MNPYCVLRHMFESLHSGEEEYGDVKCAKFIGEDPKPGCPLLVRFHTKKVRDWILENANDLRDSNLFRKVYINKDLTKFQMKEQ